MIEEEWKNSRFSFCETAEQMTVIAVLEERRSDSCIFFFFLVCVSLSLQATVIATGCMSRCTGHINLIVGSSTDLVRELFLSRLSPYQNQSPSIFLGFLTNNILLFFYYSLIFIYLNI